MLTTPGYVLFVWTQVMGWNPDEVKVFCSHFRKQLRDKNCHAYFTYRIVYARKPE